MRSDGRPLVTEFPIDPRDFITVIPRGEEPEIRDEDLVCVLRGPDRTAWMDGGVDQDDADIWAP